MGNIGSCNEKGNIFLFKGIWNIGSGTRKDNIRFGTTKERET